MAHTRKTTKTIRVAVCDDHAVVRAGLRQILEAAPGMTVVGDAAEGAAAEDIAAAERPDVFVVDLSLAGENGLDVTRLIRAGSPATAVLVLTMHDDVAYLKEAFRAGCAGYVLKKAADMELVTAIRAVASGDRYVQPHLGAALLDAGDPAAAVFPSPASDLSAREREIVSLLAMGYTNPEIATKLSLSVRTIESYRTHVQQKLGLRTRAELVAFARETGLLR